VGELPEAVPTLNHHWRLETLDLDTLAAHPLAERHSIDDQAGG
jgi:hypothetical protein